MNVAIFVMHKFREEKKNKKMLRSRKRNTNIITGNTPSYRLDVGKKEFCSYFNEPLFEERTFCCRMPRNSK